MNTFALYDSKDIQLAKMIYKLSPHRIKILALNFIKRDQYKYSQKRKYLEKELTEEHVKDLKDFLKSDLIIINSYLSYKLVMMRSAIHMTRGLDLYVIKPRKRTKYRILSLNRIFYDRLDDCFPYFIQKNIDLRIILFGKRWLDENYCKGWGLRSGKDDKIYSNYTSYFFHADILGHTHNMLNEIGTTNIKKELGLPNNRKIALFSYRKAAEGYSFFDTYEDYNKSVIKNLKLLREKGYFIICRRRVEKKDIDYYKAYNQPTLDLSGLNKFIDIEINSNDGFPTEVFKLLHISDILYLSDQSGIASVEAALERCPIYCPFEKNNSEILKETENISPPLRDMLDRNLIFNKLNDENINIYKSGIDSFLNDWYNTDLNNFWKTIYS